MAVSLRTCVHSQLRVHSSRLTALASSMTRPTSWSRVSPATEETPAWRIRVLPAPRLTAVGRAPVR